MTSETILVEQLSKTYQVPEREGGFGAAVRGFFNRKYKDVKAVQQWISRSSGRDRWLSRPERRGQDDHTQNALWVAAPNQRQSRCAGLHAVGTQA
jgi:hypothetical protein